MSEPCTKKEYQDKHSFDYRFNQTTRIRNKYHDRYPVFIECQSENLPSLTKPKFLIPIDLNVNHILHILKTRLNLNQSTPVYLYVNDRCLNGTDYICELYQKYIDPDGHLYFNYRATPNSWWRQLWFKLFG